MNPKSIKLVFNQNRKFFNNSFLFVSILIFADQISKLFFSNYLASGQNIILIPGALSLNLIHNEILHIHQYLIYFVLGIIVLPAILVYSVGNKLSKLFIWGILFLWGDVLSNNIIDAFFLGYIRDFIHLYGVATGNLADQYRTVGIALIAAGLVTGNSKKLSGTVIVKILLAVIAAVLLLALFWRYLAAKYSI